MKFYKIEEDGVIISVEARSSVSTDNTMTEIDETEYNAIKNELLKACETDVEESE